MRLSLFSALALLGVLLLTASCKNPQHAARVPLVDLGVMELFDAIPSDRIYLGSGENLVITATVRHDGRLDLKVDYDRREVDGGQTRLASRSVQAFVDRPTEVSFQVVRFTLTPKIKT
jgi:hypothetical protein